MRKAFFITIEGLEGSGKSSTINFLARLVRSKGFSVEVFRDPGSTILGEKVRKILLGKKNKIFPVSELLLYLAARSQLIEEKLKKSILNNDFVICDRFFDSTLIYQGYALGLSGLAAKGVRLFGFGIKPDLTFFLDVPPKKALARITNKDRIESRPIKFHRKLREGYINLCKKYPRRIKLINAGGNLEKIFREIEYFLEDFFKKHHYD